MKVEVTKRDIELAKDRRGDGYWLGFHPKTSCPIALALKRKTKKRVEVSFNGQAIINEFRIVCLPEKARSFITKFDNGCRVKPFTFEI